MWCSHLVDVSSSDVADVKPETMNTNTLVAPNIMSLKILPENSCIQEEKLSQYWLS